MANETILDIGRSVTLPDADASMEIQGAALGSAQLPMSALNYPLDSGIFTIPSATLISFTVAFSYTLRSNPTRIRATLIGTGSTGSIPGFACVPASTMAFNLQLTGPTGDTSHKIFWEALP